jgi:hypothetical protein
MSKPKFVPTEEPRRTVKAMAAYGIKQEGIARVLRFRSPQTLRKHFREELDLGEIEGVAQVAQTHYQMARSGKYPASTIHCLEKQIRADDLLISLKRPRATSRAPGGARREVLSCPNEKRKQKTRYCTSRRPRNPLTRPLTRPSPSRPAGIGSSFTCRLRICRRFRR